MKLTFILDKCFKYIPETYGDPCIIKAQFGENLQNFSKMHHTFDIFH